MASTSTINEWIDQLALAILAKPGTPKKQAKRRNVETFRRRIRHHPFGRTNQFDVKDRLDGLEEKFQIFDRDDLSDALHERRVELREHEISWLPDALDLLLRLSNDPIRHTASTSLYDLDSQSATEHDLTWADIEPGDQADADDAIWIKPTWSDISSDEEDLDASTAKSSPQSVRQQTKSIPANTHDFITSLYEADETPETQWPTTLLPALTPDEADANICVEEIQLIREALWMVQGYPTSIFVRSDKGGLQLHPRIILKGVSRGIPSKVLQRLLQIRNNVDTVRKWSQTTPTISYLQVIQHEINSVLHTYLNSVNNFTRALLQPQSERVVSLLGTVDFLEETATGLDTVASYVRAIRRQDAVTSFDHLLSAITEYICCYEDVRVSVLMPIFLKALELYMKPVVAWLRDGIIEDPSQTFFIQKTAQHTGLNTLWQSGHVYTVDGPSRPASFLVPFAKDIFICGKTSEFLRLLHDNTHDTRSEVLELDTFFDKVHLMSADTFVPFAAAFTSLVSTTIASVLDARTTLLKHALNDRCGFRRCLDAFDHLYLRKNGVLTDALEAKMFTRMDRCQDTWNDRFLVAELVKDVFADIPCIDVECIVVRSSHTSSRSMNSRRRSVKIMGAVAVDYILPWPVANIIPRASGTVYSRVALHLAQIRRAKYVLERVAFPAVYASPVSENRNDQKAAQAFTFILVTFANTLYDHFTMGTIDPWTESMRARLHSAPTVDEMISVHRSYIHRLQEACLITKNFKVLHDSLIGLLDMCIRFADLVTTTHAAAARRKNSDDFETSSFMSAQSQRNRKRTRRRRRQQVQHDDDVLPSSESELDAEEESSDDDDDDDEDDLVSLGEGDGYSSFIVLDEDTTVAIEIKKLQIQFKRQLDFFVAGLKGVSKAAGGDEAVRLGENVIAEGFEALAERLTWKGSRGFGSNR